MTLQAISLGQKSDTTTSFQTQPQKWNGRSVILADSAYLKKQAIEAGSGPGMGAGAAPLILALTMPWLAVLGVVAGIVAGVITGSLQTALIIIGGAAAVSFVGTFLLSGCDCMVTAALFSTLICWQSK